MVEHLETTRSVIIKLYDNKLVRLVTFSVPVGLAAPLANRILREVIADEGKTIREPWYVLIPHCVHQEPLRRSPEPAGPTSIYGLQYTPRQETGLSAKLHPEAHIVHFTIKIVEFQKVIFEGDYSMNDIFLSVVEYLVQRWVEQGKSRADQGPFYYDVEVSAATVRTVPRDLFPPEAYSVEGVFQLPQLAADRERILFRKVPPTVLLTRDPASYGPTLNFGRGKHQNGLVIMRSEVHKALQKRLELSLNVENGGYLIGTPYRQPDSPEDEDNPNFRWLLEITDVVQAQNTWSTSAMLLFTGETWSQISRRIDREYSDKKLVSWFHTHLFKATDSFGLSGMDQDLHRRFLSKPWQVAILVNIDNDNKREVRCFQRGLEGDLVECPFAVIDAETGEGDVN